MYSNDSRKESAIKKALLESAIKFSGQCGTILIGANLTLVKGKHWGMASTLNEGPAYSNFIDSSGDLQKLEIQEILQKLFSPHLIENSLAMAALNSVINTSAEIEKSDAFREIEKQAKNKNVVVVGHFPFVERLKAISAACYVFERKPHDGDLPEQEMPKYLPQADVLVLTGQVITNNCFDKIVKQAPQAYKIILGPSTPLSPVLFDFGIDVIGGVQITDPEQVYLQIAQGEHFKHLNGIQKVVLVK